MKKKANRFIINGNNINHNEEKEVDARISKVIPQEDIVVEKKSVEKPKKVKRVRREIKENNGKKKINLTLVITFIIFVVIGLTVFYFIRNDKSFNYTIINLNQYTNVVKNDGLVFINNNDEYSIIADNSLKDLLKGNTLTVYKLTVDMSTADPTSLQNAEGATEYTKDGFTYPSLLYFKDGVLKAHLEGAFTEDTLLAFIHDNNIEG